MSLCCFFSTLMLVTISSHPPASPSHHTTATNQIEWKLPWHMVTANHISSNCCSCSITCNITNMHLFCLTCLTHSWLESCDWQSVPSLLPKEPVVVQIVKAVGWFTDFLTLEAYGQSGETWHYCGQYYSAIMDVKVDCNFHKQFCTKMSISEQFFKMSTGQTKTRVSLLVTQLHFCKYIIHSYRCYYRRLIIEG